MCTSHNEDEDVRVYDVYISVLSVFLLPCLLTLLRLNQLAFFSFCVGMCPSTQEKDGGYLRVYPRRRREQQLAEGSAMGADEEEEKEEGEGKAEKARKTIDIKPAGDTLVLLRQE